MATYGFPSKSPDCGCHFDHPHLPNCDIERCSVCGGKRIACGGCPGHDPEASSWTGTLPDPVPRTISYRLIRDTFDTRIHRCFGVKGYVGEYSTWEDVRDAAVEHLTFYITEMTSRLHEIEGSSYREYMSR